MSVCTLVDSFNSTKPSYFQAMVTRKACNSDEFENLHDCLHEQQIVSFHPINTIDSIPIAFNDRSVNYGDGVFTTIYGEFTKVSTLLVQALAQHVLRLKRDCDKLAIKVDVSTLESLIVEASRFFLQQSQMSQLNTHEKDSAAFVLKVLISRGTGGRGYAPPQDSQAKMIVSFYKGEKQQKWQPTNDKSTISLGVCELKLAQQPLLAGIKHLNRLEQILIKQELMSSLWDDALVCDHKDCVIEASAANVFVFIDGKWITPPIESCGVKGVMRGLVINFFLDNKIPFVEQELNIDDICRASSMFITNALKAIQAVSDFHMEGRSEALSIKPIEAFYQDFMDELKLSARPIEAASL